MPEPIANPPSALPVGPELHSTGQEPKGVLQKNLKPLLYLGAAVLVIVAAVFSSTGAKTPAKKSVAANQPPQPLIQDNTDNNVQDMKNQATAQQKAAQQGVDPTLANATPAQQTVAQAYGPTCLPIPCVPGQPCTQQQTATMQPQLTPAQQEEQQLAARDRDLTFDSRFASNLVYRGTADKTPQQERSAALAENEGAPHSQQSGISFRRHRIAQRAASLRHTRRPIRPPLKPRKRPPNIRPK
jgi:type IV secretion system protein TrbI